MATATCGVEPMEKRESAQARTDETRAQIMNTIRVSNPLDNINCLMKYPQNVATNTTSTAAVRCYESVGFHRVVRQETESYDCLSWRGVELY